MLHQTVVRNYQQYGLIITLTLRSHYNLYYINLYGIKGRTTLQKSLLITGKDRPQHKNEQEIRQPVMFDVCKSHAL